MTKRKDLVQELKQAGFVEVGGTKHSKFRRGQVTVMVPKHSEIPNRTAWGILREAGLR